MSTSTDLNSTIVEPGEFLSEEFRLDPFPVYKRLRENTPVYQDKFQNRWIISRYEDIWNIYKTMKNLHVQFTTQKESLNLGLTLH